MRSAIELKEAYEDGATIEELALDEGTYEGKIRRLLHSVDTQMRAPGEKPNTPRRKLSGPQSDPSNVERPTGVHRISQIGGPPRKGYRRRGRK